MSSLKIEAQWLAMRKRLLRDIKKRVKLHLGHLSEEVLHYQQHYKKEFTSKWRASTKVELVNRFLTCDIAYVSDFHALNQSQRLHLRLLRSVGKKRKLTLGVEFLESAFQKELDEFLKGELSETEFLQKIQWEKRWGFNWSHYRPILNYARNNGIQVYGLNKRFRSKDGGSLSQRDSHAALCIAKLRESHDGNLLFIIFGDFHLAQDHLPKEVEKRLKKSCQTITIHQNSEKIYFQLARLGLENQVDLVRLRDDVYCVLGSPPWVKWQSYLLHLESAYDREMKEETDYTDRVTGLCRWIMDDLNLRLNLNTLSVYGAEDEKIMEIFVKSLEKKEALLACKLAEMNRTFLIPQTGVGYLSQHTINHGATLAGYYIHARLSKQSSLCWNLPRDFRRLVWLEVIAYFCSKLINHRRKTETLQDIRSFLLMDSGSDEEKEVFSLALDRRMDDLYLLEGKKRKKKLFKPKLKISYWQVAKLLGGLMGEQLYDGYRIGVIPQAQVRKMLRYSLDNKDFLDFYLDVLKTLEEVPISFISKKERL